MYIVSYYVGGPLSLRQQCMIKMRGTFTPTLIDNLPLPEAMKKEIKRIPKVHCEYQCIDNVTKYDISRPLDSEIDPLAQSSALIDERCSPKVDLTCIVNVDKSNSVHPPSLRDIKESK